MNFIHAYVVNACEKCEFCLVSFGKYSAENYVCKHGGSTLDVTETISPRLLDFPDRDPDSGSVELTVTNTGGHWRNCDSTTESPTEVDS